MTESSKYFVFYKPFNVLSQFTSTDGKSTLADFPFPKNIYPVGRLDYDSEGLLILTDDISLNDKLLNPIYSHRRTYLAQIENIPNPEQINKLRHGVRININGNIYKTMPAKVELLPAEPQLPARVPSIRYRASIPTSWLQLEITEGKNRQVRKMTAKIGFPTLRLVRYSLEDLSIAEFASGEIREFTGRELFELLKVGK